MLKGPWAPVDSKEKPPKQAAPVNLYFGGEAARGLKNPQAWAGGALVLCPFFSELGCLTPV